MRFPLLCLLMISGLFLAGCGQKGPLYLAQDHQVTPDQSTIQDSDDTEEK